MKKWVWRALLAKPIFSHIHSFRALGENEGMFDDQDFTNTLDFRLAALDKPPNRHIILHTIFKRIDRDE